MAAVAPIDKVSGDLQGAFENFQAAVAEARAMTESTPRFRDRPEHRAQAYVSLCEAEAMAYNLVIAPRMDNPRVYSQSSWHSYLYSLGQNCPDFRYGAMLLDGRQTYRLRGRLGDLKLLLMQVHSHVMGHPSSEEIGNYDFHEFERGDDGRFEVVLSAERHEGNWIRLDGESGHNFVMVRRILGDISDDPGELRIARESGPALAPHWDPEATAERLNLAGDFLRFLVKDWNIGLYDLYVKAAGGKNRFAHIEGQELAAIVGSPSTTYGLGVYELEPDEALLVEWDPPDSAYWSFQLGDVWSQSLDFMHYQTDLNMSSAVLNSDGRFRAVISYEDPGVPNWLDTRGHPEGTVVMRNYHQRSESSAPTLEKVERAGVRNRLPADTPVVTQEQREQALHERRLKYLQAYGD